MKFVNCKQVFCITYGLISATSMSRGLIAGSVFWITYLGFGSEVLAQGSTANPTASPMRSSLPAQERPTSLWADKNPYSSSQDIRNGDVITVVFREGLKVEFQSEYKGDSDHKIMSNPDKKLIEEKQGYQSDLSIARNSHAKSKSQGKIQGSLAVRVVGFDTLAENLEVEGRRETRFDNDRQILTVRGTVSRKDLTANRQIEYGKIANLEISYTGNPIPRNLQNPDIGLKPTTATDGTITYKAELSDNEKQELLLKYMKRMLGESGEEGSR